MIGELNTVYFVYLMYLVTNYFTRTDGIVGMMDCNLATYAIYTTDDLIHCTDGDCNAVSTIQQIVFVTGCFKMAAR